MGARAYVNVAASSLLLCLSGPAYSDDGQTPGGNANETLAVISESVGAIPLGVYPPVFPKNASVPPGGVEVDVQGTVGEDGFLRDYTVTAPAGAEAFADNVKSVVNVWRFQPALDRDSCKPMPQNVSEKVWFEGTADEPKISVSRLRSGSTAKTQSVPTPRWETFQRKHLFSYPKRAIRQHMSGKVTASMLIDPQGNVLHVYIWKSVPEKLFDEAVIEGLEGGKITWAAPTPATNTCATLELAFKLSDE